MHNPRPDAQPKTPSWLKTLKVVLYLLLLCQIRDIDSTSRGECLGPKQAQISTMHSYDFQIKVVQSKVWLSAIVCCSMAKLNNLWDGSMDQRKVRWSGLLFWSGWLSSSSTTTPPPPHRFI